MRKRRIESWISLIENLCKSSNKYEGSGKVTGCRVQSLASTFLDNVECMWSNLSKCVVISTNLMVMLYAFFSFYPSVNRVNISDSEDVTQASSLPRSGSFKMTCLRFLITSPALMALRLLPCWTLACLINCDENFNRAPSESSPNIIRSFYLKKLFKRSFIKLLKTTPSSSHHLQFRRLVEIRAVPTLENP